MSLGETNALLVMKSFPFIVCMVIGLWVGYYLGIQKTAETPELSSETPTPKESERELMKSFQDENKTLRDRVTELETRLADYQKQDAAALAKQEQERAQLIERRLRELAPLFDLTEEQKRKIGEIEWEARVFFEKLRAGELSVRERPFYDKDAEIAKVLTEEQGEIFEAHLLQRKDQMAEMVATSHLGRYPVTLVLSEEQKDALYERLHAYSHPETRGELNQRWKELQNREYSRTDQQLIWAGEGVLNEEQMDALKQSLKKN